MQRPAPGSGIPFVAGAARSSAAGPVRTSADGGPLREFGELAPLVAEAAVTDVFVTAGEVWADRGGGAQRAGMRLAADRARALAVALVAAGGRHIDEATPCVDVRLHDGIRVHAVLPPIAVSGTQLSIRLPRVRALSLGELEAGGAFAVVPLALVRGLVARRANVLVTGAGGSGKTTLLGAMLSAAVPTERIVTIEDVAELRIRHPHVVALEARQANPEGAGAIGLEQLVREALRMRPDRLVLGECRGAEVRELLAALNTGHDGGAGTLHANSLDDVPARLEALGALAALAPAALARQAVSAIDAVLHVERDADGRRVAAVGELELAGDRLAVLGTDAEALDAQGNGGGAGGGVVAAVLAVARQTGAPTAPTLERLAGLLRERAAQRRALEAALAGPRATARLVMVLPIVGLGFGAALGLDVVAAVAGGGLGTWAVLAGAVLLVGAWAWSRSIIRRAARGEEAPGLALELVAVALAGGGPIDRARTAAAAALIDAGVATSGWDDVDAALELARRAGVPVRGLLLAEAAAARTRARLDAEARAERAAVQLALPLGACVLPAFSLLVIVPLVSSMLAGALAPID